mmetsp:Transcript_4730/g.13120  ORF Transcript_4730/g.13120 Transcript_4730/m.13120 type:complete len:287 (+) Transcript_4730:181-1041(+)
MMQMYIYWLTEILQNRRNGENSWIPSGGCNRLAGGGALLSLSHLVLDKLVDSEAIAFPICLHEVRIAPRLEAANQGILPTGIGLGARAGGPVQLRSKPLVCGNQLRDLGEVALIVGELLQAVCRHDMHWGAAFARVQSASVRVATLAVVGVGESAVHPLCARPSAWSIAFWPVLIETHCHSFPVTSTTGLQLRHDPHQLLFFCLTPGSRSPVLTLLCPLQTLGKRLQPVLLASHLRCLGQVGPWWEVRISRRFGRDAPRNKMFHERGSRRGSTLSRGGGRRVGVAL